MEMMSLKGTDMKCPKCGGTDNLYRPELLPILTPIEVMDNGAWDWADNMYSTWPDGETVRDEEFKEEWYCRTCTTHFDAPDVKNYNEVEDEEISSQTAESNPS